MSSSFLATVAARTGDAAVPAPSTGKAVPAPSTIKPVPAPSIIEAIFADDDLLEAFAESLIPTIVTAAVCCAVCKPLHCRRHVVELMLHEHMRRGGTIFFAPLLPQSPSQRWTFERLHLARCLPPDCYNDWDPCDEMCTTPMLYLGGQHVSLAQLFCERSIPFRFASDDMSRCDNVPHLSAIAHMLAQSPTLTILIEGFARPGAPEFFGFALAQARAVRARVALLDTLEEVLQHRCDADGDTSKLLTCLIGHERALDSGVYPHPYDEGAEYFDDLRAYYEPKVVGGRIQASCAWDPDASIVRSRLRYTNTCVDSDELRAHDADGQCALVRVTGLDERGSMRDFGAEWT